MLLYYFRSVQVRLYLVLGSHVWLKLIAEVRYTKKLAPLFIIILRISRGGKVSELDIQVPKYSIYKSCKKVLKYFLLPILFICKILIIRLPIFSFLKCKRNAIKSNKV